MFQTVFCNKKQFKLHFITQVFNKLTYQVDVNVDMSLHYQT